MTADKKTQENRQIADKTIVTKINLRKMEIKNMKHLMSLVYDLEATNNTEVSRVAEFRSNHIQVFTVRSSKRPLAIGKIVSDYGFQVASIKEYRDCDGFPAYEYKIKSGS